MCVNLLNTTLSEAREQTELHLSQGVVLENMCSISAIWVALLPADVYIARIKLKSCETLCSQG